MAMPIATAVDVMIIRAALLLEPSAYIFVSCRSNQSRPAHHRLAVSWAFSGRRHNRQQQRDNGNDRSSSISVKADGFFVSLDFSFFTCLIVRIMLPFGYILSRVCVLLALLSVRRDYIGNGTRNRSDHPCWSATPSANGRTSRRIDKAVRLTSADDRDQPY